MYVNAHVRACMCVSLHIHVLKYTNYNLLYDYTTDLAEQAKHFQASMLPSGKKQNFAALRAPAPCAPPGGTELPDAERRRGLRHHFSGP